MDIQAITNRISSDEVERLKSSFDWMITDELDKQYKNLNNILPEVRATNEEAAKYLLEAIKEMVTLKAQLKRIPNALYRRATVSDVDQTVDIAIDNLENIQNKYARLYKDLKRSKDPTIVDMKKQLEKALKQYQIVMELLVNTQSAL